MFRTGWISLTRILMVTPFYFPVLGGTESFIANVSVKLNGIGMQTDIMTFNVDQRWKPWSINQIKKGKIEKINGLNVIRVPALTFLPTRFILRTNFIPGRFINKLMEYDIIHFHNEVDLSFPLFSYTVQKPKILHCHCLAITFNSYRNNPLSRYLINKVSDLYIAPSSFVAKHLVSLGVFEEKIKVVPNCVDTRLFQPPDNYSEKVNNLLLFVGRLDPKKGLLTLLESLNHIEKSVNLVIIGPPSRPWFFKKLLITIEKINRRTNHRVTYLGPSKHENLVRWYKKAAIFVSPSISESFGIASLEALSCGTPVVATNVGGVSEVIKDGENGILVPPADAVQLAESIQYLLDNEDVRKKFGENGRKWVVKNFSSEIIAMKLCQIYKELL
ncbi:MAG: glycosyltransferase family 4 protein [Nitrososphaerota archaeon]